MAHAKVKILILFNQPSFKKALGSQKHYAENQGGYFSLEDDDEVQ